jgi:hypothetical protein
MIIYPGGDDSWSFIEKENQGQTNAGGAILRFSVMEPIAGLTPSVGSNTALGSEKDDMDEESFVELYFRKVLNIDAQKLFQWVLDNRVLDKNAFLFFHPRYETEIQLLIRLLHAVGADVYHCGIPGSWEYFYTNFKAGVIIVTGLRA